jgi:hypothetical protein
MVDIEGPFSPDTVTSFQVVGMYDPKEISNVVKQLIEIRNTNPYDNSEVNYYSKKTIGVGELEFNYLGSGVISVIVNKSRVLFLGEVNRLKDFADKCGKVVLE